VNPFHQRLAQIGLEALAPFGFCLAGGYAVQAHGLLERRLSATEFTVYGLKTADIETLTRRMLAWADEIPEGPDRPQHSPRP
jgi:hypothetical protein